MPPGMVPFRLEALMVEILPKPSPKMWTEKEILE
jgi:hypothetical protein